MDMIKIKRGLSKDLPVRMSLGEPAFCTDTGELYIGMGESLPPKKVVDSLNSDDFRNNVTLNLSTLNTKTGELEISRNQLQQITNNLVQQMDDILTKTYTDVLSLNSIVSVPSDVVSGGFGKCVIKGKTLVNLAISNSSKKDVTTIHHYTEQTLTSLNKLKPDTPYTIYLYVNKKSDPLNWYTWCGLTLDGVYGFPSMSTDVKLGENFFKHTFSIPSHDFNTGFTNLNLRPVSGNGSSLPSGATVTYDYSIVIIEGECEYEWLDYFSGIKSVEAPYVLNTNENLFTQPSKVVNMEFDGVGNHVKLVAYSKLEQGKTYHCRYNYQKSNELSQHGGTVAVYTKHKPKDYHNKWYLAKGDIGIVEFASNHSEGANQNIHLNFEVNNPDFQYLAIYSGIATGTIGNHVATYSNMYLGEVSDYVEPRYNYVKPSQTITLRSLPDGTYDTYDPITGEYVKRVGVKTYNGSEYWELAGETTATHLKMYTLRPTDAVGQTDNLYCDTLLPKQFHIPEGNWVFHRDNIDISVSKELLGGVVSVESGKTWLSKNPMTVQYELVAPEISYIYGGVPQVYKNGVIQVGSETIAPEVEYQLPTSIGSKLDELTSSVAHIQNYLANDTEVGLITPYETEGALSFEEAWGNYVKTGNTVNCTMYVRVSSINKTIGAVSLKGLPFAPKRGTTFSYLFEMPKNLGNYRPCNGYMTNQGELYFKLTDGNHPINLHTNNLNATGDSQSRFMINFAYQI